MIATACLPLPLWPTGRDRVRGRGMAAWLAQPGGQLEGLILAGLALRLVVAWLLGLGVDESYMVAAGRHLQLSYFDHPPLSWWLAWGAARLFGGDAAIVVRLPFILLFALSTGLMYGLTARLFSRQAAIWAAVALNLAPVFGVSTGGWVLPDGPLICALLGFALCLVRALGLDRRAAAPGFWLGVGACAGLALLSKYSAILTGAGAALFLLSGRAERRWLRQPGPWVAATIALVLFAPVIVWNAQHGWASFAFQGGRAEGLRLRPLAPLAILAGESVYLLPWIWLPLMLCLVAAFRRGAAEPAGRLLAWMAVVPIATFALVGIWSHGRVMYHWASPGYLMLFPLLGRMIAERLRRGGRAVRVGMAATAVLVCAGVLVVGTEVRWNWLAGTEPGAPSRDPDLEAVDWRSVAQALAARGLLHRDLAVATTDWHDSGKLDYALGGAAPVFCLGDDPREYGIIRPAQRFDGRDVLIVAPRATLASVTARFGGWFHGITALPPVELLHSGRLGFMVPVFLGHRMQVPKPVS